MSNYVRLTPKDFIEVINHNSNEDMTRFIIYAQRLWKLENKIYNGELQFVEPPSKK